MVFSSIVFLYIFLPIMLLIYFIVPNKFKNLVLLIASFGFYFYGEPIYVLLMAFSIISTYIFGRLIDKAEDKKQAKSYLILAIIISIGLLVYFKYTDFIIQNINLWLANKIDLIHVILPIGISFYTFQMVSYLVDVYRGEAKVQKNILKLATYVSLFPQLIAGPIVRYTTIEEQLEKREYTANNFSLGVRRFVLGLGKAERCKIEVDHINHNRLDNRKSNLRIVTRQENMYNKSEYKNNTSGVKGVKWNKDRQKWQVQINHNKKRIHLGLYSDLEEAKQVRLKAEEKYFKIKGDR